MNNSKIEQQIAEQAADWQLLLDECEPSQIAAKQLEFDAWQQVDPRHALAAERVAQFIGQISNLKHDPQQPPPKAARKALEASLNNARGRNNKLTAGLLGLLLLISVPAAITLQHYPLGHLNADMIATSGQWQSHTLSDGSQITLAGTTAVDLDFNSKQRLLTLHHGEIYVDVAADVERPFIVKTQYGAIQALGTQFIVNHHGEYKTRLSMIESKVRVTPSTITSHTIQPVVKAGEQIQLTIQGISPITPIDIEMQQNRWQQHQLLVQGWSLADVLAELNRFHPGYIHFNAAQLQDIKVSAVLPLDKPDQALELLASNFPTIKLQTITHWLVIVKKSK
ncbi:MAG: hypothetical protein COA90_09985 [Gammaproteobacteria bacterium]|nr:MAG: hypothetical protein COA90_09985 [Gammaproteobacteria bacterium]